MKLCYQVSTPEVYKLPGITSYQGDFEKSLKALRACGYDGVELMVRDPKQFDWDEVSRLLEKYDYEVPMVCTGEIYGQDKLSFADPDDRRREETIARVKSSIDLAARIGKQINLGRARGAFLPGVPAETTYKRIFDAILEVSGYAEKMKVIIALEPVNTLGLNFINSTAEGLDFVKKVGSPAFRLMLDTAHMHIEDKNIEQAVKTSREYVTYVHLADSNRRYPGAGVFDFPAFFGYLKAAGYDGAVSVEVFPLPDQETALRKSSQFIRPFLDSE
jgi:sugar phosphate isomerase/epimerase